MSNLIVKNVNFESVDMVACKEEDGNVRVAIKSICEGLGVDYNGQMQRINRDDILPKGVCKIHIPTDGGIQEANMLDIEYLPFFLTGIKSSMVNKEIAPRIVEFKLRAKDVLATAFINKRPMCMEDIMITTLQEMKSVKLVVNNTVQKLEELDSKVETQITLTYNQAKNIQFKISERVIGLLGGKGSDDYKQFKSKYFSAIHRDIKKRLGVPSYRDILKKDYAMALSYIGNWIPEADIKEVS